MIVIYKENIFGKRLYIPQDIDYDNGLSFTDELDDAKDFEHGMWGANTELEFIKYHFPKEETKDLKTTDTYCDSYYDND